MYTEFDTRDFAMFFEGTTDKKPSENDVRLEVTKEGYEALDINIEFDEMQGFWRFFGNLK
tara:strand:+ start:549 stop:728 length:180 start_codon:yes stop_codon:yes gene_type:complete